MEKRIITILEEHTKILEEHTKILEKNDKRFDLIDRKLEQHDKRFDLIDRKLEQHDKRFEDHDEKFNRGFNRSLDHEEYMKWIKEEMATKEDMRQVINTLDGLVGLYKKTDQEQIFMGQRVSRVENDVEKIKTVVKLV